MGVDVYMQTKNRGKKYPSYFKSSRSFCYFLCGPEAYPNCEFHQIEAFFDIDLSIFKQSPINLEPQTDELEYFHLPQAEAKNDLKEIARIKDKIKQIKIDWEYNYDSINEGWTQTEELINVIEILIKKLIEQPDYHKTLKYNFNWGNYFYPERPAYHKKEHPVLRKPSYLNKTLLEDLKSVLDWLKLVEGMDVEYVTFNYA